MHSRTVALDTLVIALAVGLAAPIPEAMADVRPHAGMLRYPDVGQDQIAFSYANDLWLAPRDGGIAVPLAGPPGVEFHPRFSPDGETLVSSWSGGAVRLWRVSDGSLLHTLEGHNGGLCSLAFTPDGKTLTTASSDGTIRLWGVPQDQ